ncbi:Retrovirus-related Pol polyprotein, partial [Mucuna pruriens]
MTKILQVRFVREVRYPSWLTNVVMVRKPMGKWRMCTDYTDLNMAYSKDLYSLPNIDGLVDGASRRSLLSFTDAYSGYNQIRMHPSDETKTKFITDEDNFCYRVMSFGLKNAGVRYQRPYWPPVGSLRRRHGALTSIFWVLREYQLKLSPYKCSFGVRAGKFLGFMLTKRGIEANPKKMRECQGSAITSWKDNDLGTFLVSINQEGSPCISMPNKWIDYCEATFQELKTMLASPPILAKLIKGGRKGLTPIVFHKQNALRSRNESHQVIIRTNLPVKQILRKLDLARRMFGLDIDRLYQQVDPNLRGRPNGGRGREWALGGIILEGPRGVLIEQSLLFGFWESNNQVEYEALLVRMRLAEKLGAKILVAKCNFQLVIGQVNDDYQEKDP